MRPADALSGVRLPLLLTGCTLLAACAPSPPSGSPSPRASAGAAAPARGTTSPGAAVPSPQVVQPPAQTPSPAFFPRSILPTPEAANQVVRTVPHCRTWQLEVTLHHWVGGTGHILATFEVRNRSATRCGLTGYFGASAIDDRGVTYGVAERSTDSWFGRYPAPAEVILPAGTPPLTPISAAAPPYPDQPGHAYFAVGYSGSCREGRVTAASGWRLFPPDETVALVASDEMARTANCATVMPVGTGLGPARL